MGVQYQGSTIISSSFTQSSGTKAELIDQIKTWLVSAGWTATGGTGAWTITSAATALGQTGLQCAVVTSAAGTNCSKFNFQNTGASKVQAGGMFLLPAAAKTWQIVANKHQFFCFVPGASAGRDFMCGGSLYVPTFNGVTECLWGGSSSQNDTTAGTAPTLRTSLGCVNVGASQSPGNCVGLVNGTLTEANAVGTNAVGGVTLIVPGPGCPMVAPTQPTGGYFAGWFNGNFHYADPYMAWGATIGGSQPKIIGQVWDAFVATGSWSNDIVLTNPLGDGHNYQAITNANAGNVGSAGGVSGALFVAIT